MVRLDHAGPHFPPQCFSFRYKKEFATPSSSILAWSSFTCSFNLGLLAAPALEHTFEQNSLPLMDHCRLHPEPAYQLGGRLLAFQCFQRDLRLELWRVLLAFRHL
ncbi:hypothetical protein [Paracoccus indicus]|uniref:hypothetical protein n=1 Tax=Paracoccus indicus TaxID=2079229 RepID=UPI0013B36620|nr:hypothetical protein [Paracoccus indicus]